MILRIVFFLFALTCFKNKSFCQTNFRGVDSLARCIGPCDSLDISRITYLLTNGYDDPIKKVRAIYTWIADNISYDCKAYHLPSKRLSDPDKILKARKAVCGGYAYLLQEMCSKARIQCLTIDGYGKNSLDDIGESTKESNHSWNAVKIDGEWKLIDVTWSSGYTDHKVTQFTKEFSDFFFFTDPNEFLLSHYPELKSWIPPKSKLSAKEFSNGPVITPGYFEYGVKNFEPRNGQLVIRQKQIIELKIDLEKASTVYKVRLLVGEGKKEEFLSTDYKIEGNTLIIKTKFDKPGVYPFRIFLNSSMILGYRLVVL